MIVRQRSTLFLSALAGGASLLALTYAHPAVAQAQSDQPAASSGGGLDEVIVTARRKEEKAQTVPITMTTFSQQALESQNITNIDELYRDTPGISSCCGFGNSTSAFIRGVLGSQTYFGGAPQITNSNPHQLYFDVGSIQLLKGPQGTLFGLASDAGALVIEPKRPTDNFEGYVKIEVGDYGHRESEFVLNVPVVDNKLLLRIGGQYNHTDGFFKDLASGEGLDDVNYWLGRVQATFRPTDDIENNLMIGYDSSNTNGLSTVSPGYIDELDPNGLVAKVYGYQKVLAEMNRQYGLGYYTVVGYPIPGGEYTSQYEKTAVNTTTYDFNDNVTFKNIFAYAEYNIGLTQTDPGAGFDVLILGSAPGRPKAPFGPIVNYSEEFQALGKALDGKLSFTVGTFNQWAGTRGPHTVQYSLALGGVTGSASQNDSRTHAVYAQGTYDLSDLIDGLSFTGGYRYNWDTVFGAIYNYNTAGTFLAGVTHTVTSKAPNYTMSLDYQLNPQTLFYISDSKGYSRGGVNLTIGLPVVFQTYQPESLNNVEVGVKTDNEVFGIKTRANVSGYYGFYDNIQLPTTIVVIDANGNVSAPNPFENAATAHIEGIEGQFTIVPNEQFDINLAATWSHGAYDTYITPSGVDQHDQKFAFLAPWYLNAKVSYHLPVDESLGKMTFSAVWAYQSHIYDSNLFLQPKPFITPGFSQTDFNFQWTDVLGTPGLDGAAYITNVTGQPRGLTAQLYGSLGFEARSVLPPTMWGASLKYNFGPK